VALILAATLLACGAEGLTGTRARPNRSVIGPSGEAQGVTPSTDPGEEVALVVSGEVVRLNVNNASLINISRCYVSCGYQSA